MKRLFFAPLLLAALPLAAQFPYGKMSLALPHMLVGSPIIPAMFTISGEPYICGTEVYGSYKEVADESCLDDDGTARVWSRDGIRLSVIDSDLRKIRTLDISEATDSLGSLSIVHTSQPQTLNSRNVLLTQNLFNDDDKLEYIAYSGKQMKIMREDGRVLQVLPYDSEAGLGAGLLIFDDAQPPRAYLFTATAHTTLDKPVDGDLDLHNLGMFSNVELTFYEIDRATSSVRRVDTPACFTLAQRGPQVSVSLGDAAQAGTQLSVVNVAGQTLVKHSLEAGQRNVSIPTGLLSRGVYVVTLALPGGEKREVQKFVVQ